MESKRVHWMYWRTGEEKSEGARISGKVFPSHDPPRALFSLFVSLEARRTRNQNDCGNPLTPPPGKLQSFHE